jgi:hypothetical protein
VDHALRGARSSNAHFLHHRKPWDLLHHPCGVLTPPPVMAITPGANPTNVKSSVRQIKQAMASAVCLWCVKGGQISGIPCCQGQRVEAIFLGVYRHSESLTEHQRLVWQGAELR